MSWCEAWAYWHSRTLYTETMLQPKQITPTQTIARVRSQYKLYGVALHCYAVKCKAVKSHLESANLSSSHQFQSRLKHQSQWNPLDPTLQPLNLVIVKQQAAEEDVCAGQGSLNLSPLGLKVSVTENM